MKPELFRELWLKFGPARNERIEALVKELTVERHYEAKFNEGAARTAVMNYRSTVAFAGLRDDDDLDVIERGVDLRLEALAKVSKEPVAEAPPARGLTKQPPRMHAPGIMEQVHHADGWRAGLIAAFM